MKSKLSLYLKSTLCFLLGSTLSACGTNSSQQIAQDTWQRPAAAPHPQDNAPTPARIELGRNLFFDPRLSGSNSISCATCHNPALGWTDGQATAIGFNSKRLHRASPTVLNAAFLPLQMWDGRKNSLEDQALGPIESADEMNLPLDQLEEQLRNIPGYASLFDKAYPGEGVSRQTVAKAIASYERTLLSTASPFDKWRRGDDKAVSAAAKRGFELFTGKANCSLCHQGFNFTDNGFHNIGVQASAHETDDGRFVHRKVKVLKGAFKTPTLRDIELTGPYMHNGMYKTLEEVVDHYDRGGDNATNLDANMKPLHLTAQEKHDLVAFMSSLTGEHMNVQIPTLPPSTQSLASK